MFKSEFQRRATAILESDFKTKTIQVTKQEKNMHSMGLQPKLRDAYVFMEWFWIVLLTQWLNARQM